MTGWNLTDATCNQLFTAMSWMDAETSGCNMLQRRSIPYILDIVFEKVWEGIEKVHLLDSSFKVTDAWSMIPPIIITYLYKQLACITNQQNGFNVIISYMIGWFLCCNCVILLYYYGFIAVTWISFAHSRNPKNPNVFTKKEQGKSRGWDPSLKSITISHLKRRIPWKTNILERQVSYFFRQLYP